MIARELQLLLTRNSGYQFGEIDQRLRPLREKKLIPFGPRGLHAPHLEPLHCALALLCMVSRRAADAGEVMARAMTLRSVARAGVHAFHGTHVELAPAIAFGLQTRGEGFERAEVWCDGSLAWVGCTVNGAKQRVLFTDDKKVEDWVAEFPDTYDATGAHYTGHRFVITNALVAEIAAAMAESDAGDARKAG